MMRKSLSIALLVFLGAGFVPALPDTSKDIAAIDELMTAWHHAAAVADEETYFGLMAPGAMFLGTDVTERWTREEFREWAAPRFQGDKAWVYRARERNIHLAAAGAVAWLDEDLESESYWDCRGTAVLEKIDGHWKIRHYSLTFTIPNAAVSEIKPVVMRELRKGR